MKNIDKVKLGERLLKYFKKHGCEVQVIKQMLDGNSHYKVPMISVFKISPRECKLGAFQEYQSIWNYDSYSVNSSWDSFMKEIVTEYCSCKMPFSHEFVNANSPEELDLKLAVQGL